MKEEIPELFLFLLSTFYLLCCSRKILIQFTEFSAFVILKKSYILHPLIDKTQSYIISVQCCIWMYEGKWLMAER